MNGNEFDGLAEYVDYLRWRDRCSRLDGTGFQTLFEDVMLRLEPDTFEAVVAYGNLGDRKTDGILYGEGTVYQVFSPWDLMLGPTIRKIDEDLAGAVAFWADDLKRWVFVYNTRNRGGLPTDVVAHMSKKEEEYTGLTVARVSDYRLWRRVREEMDPKDRAEVLGPLPEGVGGTVFPRPGMSEEELEELRRSRVVLLHQGERPIDVATALEALEPERAFGPPFRLEPPVDEVGWVEAARQQASAIDELLAEAGDRVARLAVFPLSDIPLLLHLGFVLSDRVGAKLFQYHRERDSWAWPEGEEADLEIGLVGLPDSRDETPGEVCVLVSLSAGIEPEQVRPWTQGALGTVELSVADPDTRWLKSPEQLRVLADRFRNVLKGIRRSWPNCSRIHLFYAGPAPGAVAIGQTINPRMNPPVETYQFDRGYTPALGLPPAGEEAQTGAGAQPGDDPR